MHLHAANALPPLWIHAVHDVPHLLRQPSGSTNAYDDSAQTTSRVSVLPAVDVALALVLLEHLQRTGFVDDRHEVLVEFGASRGQGEALRKLVRGEGLEWVGRRHASVEDVDAEGSISLQGEKVREFGEQRDEVRYDRRYLVLIATESTED